jgi:drug/metabolite transporter (DMT)-like permease
MLMNMEPIFTIILAAILLGERLSPLQLAGAGMVITGIILITGRIRKAGN